MIDAGLTSATDALPTVKLSTHGSARPYGELPWTMWMNGPGGEIFRQEYPRTSNFDPQTKENLSSSSETQLPLRNFRVLPHPTFHSYSSIYQPLHLSTAHLFVSNVKSCSVHNDHLHLPFSSSVWQNWPSSSSLPMF